MATRRYKLNVGETADQVVSEAGAAVNSDAVELTIELAATTVGITGGTRTINQFEALECIERIKEHILRNQWPPA